MSLRQSPDYAPGQTLTPEWKHFDTVIVRLSGTEIWWKLLNVFVFLFFPHRFCRFSILLIPNTAGCCLLKIYFEKLDVLSGYLFEHFNLNCFVHFCHWQQDVDSIWNHMKFGRNISEPILSLWPISVYNRRTSVFISLPKAISSRVHLFTHPMLFRSNEVRVRPKMFP